MKGDVLGWVIFTRTTGEGVPLDAPDWDGTLHKDYRDANNDLEACRFAGYDAFLGEIREVTA